MVAAIFAGALSLVSFFALRSATEMSVAGSGAATASSSSNSTSALAELTDSHPGKHVEVIVHAGRQDLEIFFERYDAVPSRIYDIQLAAAFVGGRGVVGIFTGPDPSADAVATNDRRAASCRRTSTRTRPPSYERPPASSSTFAVYCANKPSRSRDSKACTAVSRALARLRPVS